MRLLLDLERSRPVVPEQRALHGEHAIQERGVQALEVCLRRESESEAEGNTSMPMLRLSEHQECVAFDFDLEVVGPETRRVHVDDDVLRRLVHFSARPFTRDRSDYW